LNQLSKSQKKHSYLGLEIIEMYELLLAMKTPVQ